jgi:hypothetical protein
MGGRRGRRIIAAHAPRPEPNPLHVLHLRPDDKSELPRGAGVPPEPRRPRRRSRRHLAVVIVIFTLRRRVPPRLFPPQVPSRGRRITKMTTTAGRRRRGVRAPRSPASSPDSAASRRRRGGERSTDATEALALLPRPDDRGPDGIANGERPARRADACRGGGALWSDDDCDDDDGDGCGVDADGDLVALSPAARRLHEAANALPPTARAN